MSRRRIGNRYGRAMDRIGILVCAAVLFPTISLVAAKKSIPDEPVRIGTGPQFLFDNYLVDNHWAIHYKRQAVQRVQHQVRKHPGNPIIKGDQPSYVAVLRDEETGLFRMYYQANYLIGGGGGGDDNQETLPDFAAIAKKKGRKFKTHISYAESKDGTNWTKPHLNLFPWHKRKPNNIVISRRDSPAVETCSPAILELPEADRNGFRYWIIYRAKGRGGKELNGIRAAASKDGVHFEEADDRMLYHLHSDHPNTLVHDPSRNEYVLYCRAKDKYRAWGETMIDTGASRRVARIANDRLFSGWGEQGGPQTVLIPDERDNEAHYNFFYGLPVRLYAGVYFGFLEPFRMNDFIHTELATSRDGIQWQRFPQREKFIAYGEEGSWDDTMNFGSPSWVEVGDEWWFYYSGWDGPHGTPIRTGAIGLAKLRKEGFVSLRGPQGGGVVCTRRLIWPGGELRVNADATKGELKVRLSDAKRKPLPGFDYDDCVPFVGDKVRHAVEWRGSSIEDLKGREIRIEFYLQKADLFTFVAE
jgi:hypothetical protein